MGRKRAGQKDRKKVGGAEGCEEGGRGKGMEGRRAGQKDGKKVGVVEGWEEGGWGNNGNKVERKECNGLGRDVRE